MKESARKERHELLQGIRMGLRTRFPQETSLSSLYFEKSPPFSLGGFLELSKFEQVLSELDVAVKNDLEEILEGFIDYRKMVDLRKLDRALAMAPSKNFVANPEKQVCRLPQPYRMIMKVLEQDIFEVAFDQIERRMGMIDALGHKVEENQAPPVAFVGATQCVQGKFSHVTGVKEGITIGARNDGSLCWLETPSCASSPRESKISALGGTFVAQTEHILVAAGRSMLVESSEDLVEHSWKHRVEVLEVVENSFVCRSVLELENTARQLSEITLAPNSAEFLSLAFSNGDVEVHALKFVKEPSVAMKRRDCPGVVLDEKAEEDKQEEPALEVEHLQLALKKFSSAKETGPAWVHFRRHPLSKAWHLVVCRSGSLSFEEFSLFAPSTETETEAEYEEIPCMQHFLPAGISASALQADLLLVGCTNGSTSVWNLSLGTFHTTLGRHNARITSVAFAGDLVLTGAADGALKGQSLKDFQPFECAQVDPALRRPIEWIHAHPVLPTLVFLSFKASEKAPAEVALFDMGNATMVGKLAPSEQSNLSSMDQFDFDATGSPLRFGSVLEETCLCSVATNGLFLSVVPQGQTAVAQLLQFDFKTLVFSIYPNIQANAQPGAVWGSSENASEGFMILKVNDTHSNPLTQIQGLDSQVGIPELVKIFSLSTTEQRLDSDPNTLAQIMSGDPFSDLDNMSPVPVSPTPMAIRSKSPWNRSQHAGRDLTNLPLVDSQSLVFAEPSVKVLPFALHRNEMSSQRKAFFSNMTRELMQRFDN